MVRAIQVREDAVGPSPSLHARLLADHSAGISHSQYPFHCRLRMWLQIRRWLHISLPYSMCHLVLSSLPRCESLQHLPPEETEDFIMEKASFNPDSLCQESWDQRVSHDFSLLMSAFSLLISVVRRTHIAFSLLISVVRRTHIQCLGCWFHTTNFG